MSVNFNVDTYAGTYGSEYTSQRAASYYDTALASIISIGQMSPGDLNDTVAANLAIYVSQLTDLAQGFQPGTTTPLDLPITASMARVIDSLLKSLRAAGASVGVGVTNTISLANLQQWHDLYIQGIDNVLATGVRVGGATATRSVQSLIELEYVRTGNEQIFSELSQLKDAMSLTQKALSVLSDLQHLKDKVQAEIRTNQGSFFGNVSFLAGAYANAGISTIKAQDLPAQYHDDMDQFFSNRLGVTLTDGTPTGVNAIIAEGSNLVTRLSALIAQVALVIPRSADKSSLTDKLDQIKADISDKGVIAWMLDNYGPEQLNNPNVPTSGQDTTKAGDYQQNLTQAVQTAQNLNDTQNTSLKTAMFNFQEFYKSAGDLLTALNRIIQQMATKAGGG